MKVSAGQNRSLKLGITLIFMGHFNEPPLHFETELGFVSESMAEKRFDLEFNPKEGTWTVSG